MLKLIMYGWFVIGLVLYIIATIDELKNPGVEKPISRRIAELIVYLLFGAGVAAYSLIKDARQKDMRE